MWTLQQFLRRLEASGLSPRPTPACCMDRASTRICPPQASWLLSTSSEHTAHTARGRTPPSTTRISAKPRDYTGHVTHHVINWPKWWSSTPSDDLPRQVRMVKHPLPPTQNKRRFPNQVHACRVVLMSNTKSKGQTMTDAQFRIICPRMTNCGQFRRKNLKPFENRRLNEIPQTYWISCSK